ncbi:MAG: hypothetical protein MRECE_7c026 [Mycoplasmataceae bacterium CE_OT135]|nr:MAG: hypothetical protein MRECE_7c026 [Mycoplasmataceae bacterium CE_OT135]
MNKIKTKNNGVFADHEPQRLEKCLVCPQTKENGNYCSEHARISQAIYENWKWDQEKELRKKLGQAINQHLKDKPKDYLCQIATCPALKEIIEKEVFHG